MRIDREPKVRLAKPIDIEIAIDGDEMEIWAKDSGVSSTPRWKISIKEALVAGTSRPLEPEDLIPTSNN